MPLWRQRWKGSYLPVLQRAEYSVYPIEAGVANISASAWILVAGKPAFVLWLLRPHVWPGSDGVGWLVSPGWELPVALRHVALVRQLGNRESMREKFVLSLFQELVLKASVQTGWVPNVTSLRWLAV